MTEVSSNKKVRVGVVFAVDLRSYKSFLQDWGSIPKSQHKTKMFHYWAFESMGLKQGDLAVVNTPSHGFTVVLVAEVANDLEDATARCRYPSLKPIIDKVDLETFKKTEADDKRRQELSKSLVERARKAAVARTMEDLLKDDPEALKELEELKTLGGI